jgi:hypothetical protein
MLRYEAWREGGEERREERGREERNYGTANGL